MFTTFIFEPLNEMGIYLTLSNLFKLNRREAEKKTELVPADGG